MGILVTRLFRLFWRKEEVKIVLVGLDNAGKTTVLYKLCVT
jgi:GTPase SAR1 family protein